MPEAGRGSLSAAAGASAAAGGSSAVVQDFVNRQAEWSEEMRDYEAAADMYLQVRGTQHGSPAAMTSFNQHLM